MSLKILDKSVISHIRSTITINTLTQCVTELVLNSLDAKSTAIAVRINLNTFQIQVVDNGIGLSYENLEKIGQRYMTSKCHSLSDLRNQLKCFGFRGEALASIINTSSKVVITTRELNSTDTLRKTIENDVENFEIGKTSKMRPDFGTTITVEGFMNMFPVRQQCIKKNELISIRKNLESLAIIFPSVSFTLRNDETGTLVFDNEKTTDVLTSFQNIHKEVASEHFVFLKLIRRKTSVEGLINNTDFHHNKQLQYVYVNRRPVICSKVQNYANSFFKSLLNGREKQYPMYILHIKCPYSEIDINLEPQKTSVLFKKWDKIQCFLKKLMQKALKIEKTPEKVQKNVVKAKSQFGVSIIDGFVRGVAKRDMKENNVDLADSNKIIEDSSIDNKVRKNKRKLDNNEKRPEEKKIKYDFIMENLKDQSVMTANRENEDEGKDFIMKKFVNSLKKFSANEESIKDDIEIKSLSSTQSTTNTCFFKNLSISDKEPKPKMISIGIQTATSEKNDFEKNKCESEHEFILNQNKNQQHHTFDFNFSPLSNIFAGFDNVNKQNEMDHEEINNFTMFEHGELKINKSYSSKMSVSDTISHLSPIPKDSAANNFLNMSSKFSQSPVNGLFKKKYNFSREQDNNIDLNESKYFAEDKVYNDLNESRFFAPRQLPLTQNKMIHSTQKTFNRNLNETINSRFFPLNIAPHSSQFSININLKSNLLPDLFGALEQKNIMNNVPIEMKTSYGTQENSAITLEEELNSMKAIKSENKISEWVQNVNNMGATFFKNTNTGYCTFCKPQTEEYAFSVAERFDFMPKGQSPIIKAVGKVEKLSPKSKENFLHEMIKSYEDELLVIKWKNYVHNESDSKKFFEELYMQKSKKIEESVPSVIKSRRAKNVAANAFNTGMTFTNKLFTEIKVIGQVDCKFIAAYQKNKNLLLLFDQHAVHERVRLEELERTATNSVRVKEKIQFFLKQNELNLLKTNQNKLMNLVGIRFQCFRNGIHVEKIPLCLYNKSKKGVNLVTLLECLIKEIIDTLKDNNGIMISLPKLLQNIINSEACRGAIMFGDKLSQKECKHHLKMVGKCKLPFQCAHGRPTLTPLITINTKFEFKDLIKKPNLYKLSQYI